MKIQIETIAREEIDVELPYYYKQDVGGDDYDSVVYGRIDEKQTVTVHRNHSYSRSETSVEFEVYSTDFNRCGCYFKEKFRCTKEVFEDVFSNALYFAKNLEKP